MQIDPALGLIVNSASTYTYIIEYINYTEDWITTANILSNFCDYKHIKYMHM